MKKFLLLILLISCMGSAFADQNKIEWDRVDVENYLNGRTVSDLIIEMANEVKASNYTKHITLKQPNGLRIIFAGEDYINLHFVSTDVFGVYSKTLNSIGMNVQNLNEYLNSTNHTQAEIDLKTFNTFQHEITHYMYEQNMLPEVEQSIGIEYSTYPTVSNYGDFKFLAVEGITADMPPVLRNTLNFQALFPPTPNASYSLSSLNDEIIARVMAVCVGYNENYTNYYDMLVYSDFDYCNNKTFHHYVDNQYNIVYKEFIISHVKEYDPSRYYEVLKTTNQLPTVGENVSDFINNIMYGVVNFIFVLFILTPVIGFISAFTYLVIRIGKRLK